MNKIARVIVTKRCPRQCPGCCNNQFNFDGDVPELTNEQLKDYELIVLTGGEPILVLEEMRDFIKQHPDKKFVLYTSYGTLASEYRMLKLLQLLDGITFTVHYENWEKSIKDLLHIQTLINKEQNNNHTMDTRLSIDDRIPTEICNLIDTRSWTSIKRFEWLDPAACQIPTGEDLFYMPLD